MNDQINKFVTQLVTDLVTQGVLARRDGETWVLPAELFGYAARTPFGTKDELISKISAAIMGRYAGLKAAS